MLGRLLERFNGLPRKDLDKPKSPTVSHLGLYNLQGKLYNIDLVSDFDPRLIEDQNELKAKATESHWFLIRRDKETHVTEVIALVQEGSENHLDQLLLDLGYLESEPLTK